MAGMRRLCKVCFFFLFFLFCCSSHIHLLQNLSLDTPRCLVLATATAGAAQTIDLVHED